MTLKELKQRFPLHCDVQLTQQTKEIQSALGFKGERGRVEGYHQTKDLAGQPFFTLYILNYDRNHRDHYQPSMWELVPKDEN